MLYNRCTGICKSGKNIYPQRIRRRSKLGHIFRKKVHLMGQEISIYIYILYIKYPTTTKLCTLQIPGIQIGYVLVFHIYYIGTCSDQRECVNQKNV